MNQTDLILETSLEEVRQYRFNVWTVRNKFSLSATKQIEFCKQTLGRFRLRCHNLISPVIVWTFDFIEDREQMTLTEREIFSAEQSEIDAFLAAVNYLSDREVYPPHQIIDHGYSQEELLIAN